MIDSNYSVYSNIAFMNNLMNIEKNYGGFLNATIGYSSLQDYIAQNKPDLQVASTTISTQTNTVSNSNYTLMEQ